MSVAAGEQLGTMGNCFILWHVV